MPIKVQVFFWAAILGRTLTLDNLIHRGQILDPLCPVCGLVNESIGHLFLHCSISLQVWKGLSVEIPDIFINLFTVGSLREWLVAWPIKKGEEITERVAFVAIYGDMDDMEE
ncbi:hypothetical protein FRX31_031447 [Thalictrum thalictroides]|uniref:Reverse transcriptase zinc-binding domain-containing protein n=1 Tax=Thalictrum thalictroides TaxID=46969 RepID=A0A7J6V1V0_THATH|nr:hypothetical protein FRX31_031447 [Thalictrum thalictroides]